MRTRDFLAALEAQFPPWLIAVAMLLAAAGFLASYIRQQRSEPLRLYPPLSAAVTVGLAGMAVIYIWLALDNTLPLGVRAGAIRPVLFALAVALALYNGGNLTAALRSAHRAWQRRRHG